MITSQSSLPFAYLAVPSVSYSHIRGCVRLASDIELTSDVACNVVLPNSWLVANYDMACQVGKAYNIFLPVSWSLLKGVDAIMRS